MSRTIQSILRKLDLEDVSALLYHFPRRYEDRCHWVDPFTVEEGVAVTVRGKIVSSKANRYRRYTEVVLQLEGAFQTLSLMWFNMPFMAKNMPVGRELIVHGRIKISGKGAKRKLQILHPEYEDYEVGEDEHIHINRSLVPIYPLRNGVKLRALRKVIWELLQRGDVEYPELYSAPEKYLSRKEAIRTLHFPEDDEKLEVARKRLALDELVCMEIALVRRRQKVIKAVKNRQPAHTDYVQRYMEQLPFDLTAGQKEVCREIDEDLKRKHPMNRLLQGDVGSGKTVVAVYALLRCVECGKNGALLAPTEILANQHYNNIKKLVEPLGIGVELSTRNTKPLQDSLFNKEPTLFVGTHALLQDKAVIPNLGLGVIDEQHKFGVMQRAAFMDKADEVPDLLVMTATPIPRTLCLTAYGDLDVSVIKTMPEGRSPIKTVIRQRDALTKVWDFIKKENAAGRQAYIVYPLVEESERKDLISVKEGYKELQQIFGTSQVGMVHGKMKGEEKDAVMTRFRKGELGLLVATSVIEVGVDVPSATVMVIEHAGRFGLAQLHQLRGRVGRGSLKSYCILVDDAKTEDSELRLRVMEETTDGFALAEKDFEIRGPGNILGTEQSGLPPLKVAKFPRDLNLISEARKIAEVILAVDPELAQNEGLKKVLGHYWVMANEVANN
ncbi:MAG: ATP-dependent DNA helicase RecG [Verrucomicrobiota bacterium]